MVIVADCIIVFQCVNTLLQRLSLYEGMNNRQIFNLVVDKLQEIGMAYPTGVINVFGYETVTYGYVMANIEVYILPLSLVLILMLMTKWIAKK